MNPVYKEWQILKHTIQYFTRIPLPYKHPYSPSHNQQALRYLPLIGVLAGLWSSGVFTLIHHYFSLDISIFMSIISTILLTGAIHEDGFADFCDSLGGMTPEKRLTIMKDSNMGAFGVIGLLGILSGKYLFLIHMPVSHLPCIFISGHMLSRYFILFIILFLPYSGHTKPSKSLPMIQKNQVKNTVIATVIIGLIMLTFPLYAWVSIPILTLITLLLMFYYKKSIGGYTGDYLGAAQQLTEICHYCSVLFWLNL